MTQNNVEKTAKYRKLKFVIEKSKVKQLIISRMNYTKV